MEFNGIPSYANDYEFIVCCKDPKSETPDIYEFYSVETDGWMAEKIANQCKQKNLKPIIIHNVRIQGRRR